jgi:hypothetical protein
MCFFDQFFAGYKMAWFHKPEDHSLNNHVQVVMWGMFKIATINPIFRIEGTLMKRDFCPKIPYFHVPTS